MIKVLEMLKIKSDIKNIKQNLELKNKFHDQPDFGLIEPFYHDYCSCFEKFNKS